MMKTVAKRIGLFVGILIVAAVGSVVPFLMRGGAFNEASSISNGVCTALNLDQGSAEDIEPDYQANEVYLSVLDRRGIVLGKPVKGTVLKVSFSENGPLITPALSRIPEEFRPHGMSLVVSSDGSRTLFVINHASPLGEAIEVFEKQPGQDLFAHIDSLSDETLVEPNDIVGVGRRQFYVANDSGASNSLEQAAEMLFAIGLSPLTWFDGKSFTIPVDKLKSSGGINVNLSTRQLYVGETMGKSIRVYQLDEANNVSGLHSTIVLDTAPDNISVAPDGTIWVANHMNTLALVRHFTDASSIAPTQVQIIRAAGDGWAEAQTIYENTGDEISAGSVAVPLRDKLVIGSITDPKILVCDFLD